jgi:hypothetical protein
MDPHRHLSLRDIDRQVEVYCLQLFNFKYIFHLHVLGLRFT